MTPQERLVWKGLRDLNRAFGAHFRRQAPIGPFIADFADYARRLVVEIDGGQHGGEADAARDGFLVAEGFRVLRFWNSDVNSNLDGVLQMVLEAVSPSCPPPPSPPHRGEGGRFDPQGGALDWRGIPSPLVGKGQGEGAGG
jgi:very-short-patch-repair endonuclease